jgi:hypothetical protein
MGLRNCFKIEISIGRVPLLVELKVPATRVQMCRWGKYREDLRLASDDALRAENNQAGADNAAQYRVKGPQLEETAVTNCQFHSLSGGLARALPSDHHARPPVVRSQSKIHLHL